MCRVKRPKWENTPAFLLDPFHHLMNGLLTCMWSSQDHCPYVKVNHIYRLELIGSLAGARLFFLSESFFFLRICHSKDVSFWDPSCNYHGQRDTFRVRHVHPVNEVKKNQNRCLSPRSNGLVERIIIHSS